MKAGRFNDWADDYDESIAPFLDKFPFIGYHEVLAAIRELVLPVSGLKVLDVGIGTGLLSAELAAAGCNIYGIDFSPGMLEKAAQKIPDAKLACVDVTAEHLGPFNGEKFDRIISSYFFHHLDLKQKVTFLFRAASENLDGDGKIIIGDIGFENFDAHESARRKWQEQWDYDESYWCADELISAVKQTGLDIQYRQTSECSGILIYEK
ncbi:MAG: class I SAM-dependent methyltransferase [Candidatus Zixiibacteriota bacterium]|nr:MAG: class I SAM-dependent methyltransferase [candidate division Zixibacteria bacterium]